MARREALQHHAITRCSTPSGAALLAALGVLACSNGDRRTADAGPPPSASAVAPAPPSSAASAPSAAAIASASPSSAASAPSAAAIAPASPAPLTGCPEGMKEIGGGTMTMGSGYRPDERPLHAIQVAAFCMDRTEVTTQAYEACLTAGACTRPKGTHPRCNAGKADRGEHPINCVDWKQATTYCDVAGKRLPTEEEWEFAARGPAGRAFPWGDQLTGSEICWNGFRNTRKEHGWEGTCPVGSYPAGDTPGTGIADLSGGVTEWLSTFDCPYDPKERCGKTRRGLRGGSWFDNTEAYVRAASRGGYAPTEQSYFVGFRCARDRR